MADAGWEVTFLSAPIAGMLTLPTHSGIAVQAIGTRPSHEMGKVDYVRYTAAAVGLAMRLRPDVVYASDPLGAGPGLLAAQLVHATLVYHEHDSPAPGALHPWVARLRSTAARAARLVVFPNEARARIAHDSLAFSRDRLRIVWNLPRLAELTPVPSIPEAPLLLYYHGSITPECLPEVIVEAIRNFGGRVRLRIAGYEAPGARGYLKRLLKDGRGPGGEMLVEYVGPVSRDRILKEAARAHVGLALFMPRSSENKNMRHMTGASNKAFDYMAAGLALLVSDLADWRDMFVAPGFARACDPGDPESVVAALRWFIDQPEERRTLAMRGRSKIEAEWNYDTDFARVMSDLSLA